MYNVQNYTPQQAAVCNHAVRAKFEHFVLEQDHPCLMAQHVFRMEQVYYRFYDKFGGTETTSNLLSDLDAYVNAYDFNNKDFLTFLAIFKFEETMDEEQFERKLWQQLNELHRADDQPWDSTVSSDPEDKNFSFSLRGKAFYLVGLHPGASRPARRAPYASVAFNLHWQFEALRGMGAYTRLRDKIRQRDTQRNGSYNPMMEDFGSGFSEARQYSGRQVNEDWNCPFLKANSASGQQASAA